MMSKYFIPLNLTKFEIITPNINTQQVTQELNNIIEWFKNNQTIYYDTNFNKLANTIIDSEQSLKGSLNSLGRKFNIIPPIAADYQSYNMAEMFRTSILSKMGGYLQNNILLDIISTIPEATVDNVLNEYKKKYKFATLPTYQFIKRTIERITKTGVIHSTPTADGVLPFWATDTHYSKITNDNNNIHFTLKLPQHGPVTLKFTIPHKDRFQGNKVTRPNVYIKNGKLIFGFTIQHNSLPKIRTTNLLGVDLGVVTPFVGTVISPDKNTYSPAFTPDKLSNRITLKIDALKMLSEKLWVKENLNKLKSNNHTSTGHARKAEILRIERLRVRSKIARLKNERVHHVANQIINIATQYNAAIILENLNWVPNSKWEQALQQNTVEQKAARKGLTTRKINPTNTSQTCPKCNNKITHTSRNTTCLTCKKKLNRDVLASRNIALRALPSKTKPNFSNYTQSLHTRVTKPATTGDTKISYVKSYTHARNTT